MVTSYDPLQLARRQVDQFDEVLAQHCDAMACSDCEDGIELGMNALEWIETAEGILISAENDCLVEYSLEAHAALQRGYEQWLAAAERLVRVASEWERKGFQVAHLADLREG